MTGIEVHAVDKDRWDDLVDLFGPSGAYSGCWCMWFRIPSGEFSRNGNAGNRAALESLVADGEPIGLLGYADGQPVGWCTVAPRPAYPRILRSPALKPEVPADAGVWSVPCFFTRRGQRGGGVAAAMLEAAVAHARAQGASALEGYPVDTGQGRVPPPAELYTGTVALFERAGFTEHRRPPTGRRVIMRRPIPG
ncbi:GNAT family N-acetyltransferase [Phytohabitans rumicis]|uniref:GNAT family acetyltransferase n=1 Tax=Phytohabitans rumicis TaxID=1076125 RepID=A0A6V8KZ89_9ACTN|nr:GNAT family N-acetyltransferase [Phytohabitans rumicis]GFJ88670.1 GNAT family acetyltransferase [Phytohabitans rumicis]